jgi:hypothetical protein
VAAVILNVLGQLAYGFLLSFDTLYKQSFDVQQQSRDIVLEISKTRLFEKYA